MALYSLFGRNHKYNELEKAADGRFISSRTGEPVKVVHIGDVIRFVYDSTDKTLLDAIKTEMEALKRRMPTQEINIRYNAFFINKGEIICYADNPDYIQISLHPIEIR